MPTALNTRKGLLLDMQCPAHVTAELQLLAALFTLHPKSPSAWQHRRWALCFRYQLHLQRESSRTRDPVTNSAIVGRMWESTPPPTGGLRLGPASASDAGLSNCIQFTAEQLACELALVDLVNQRYAQNYYGWLHRAWVLRQVCRAAAATSDTAAPVMQVLETEQAYTWQWLQRHTSDHCAVHYFTQIAAHYCDAAKATTARWLCEQLDLSRQLLVDRPGAEALWSLRRALLQQLLRHYLVLLTRSYQITDTVSDGCVVQSPVGSTLSKADSTLLAWGPDVHDNIAEDANLAADLSIDGPVEGPTKTLGDSSYIHSAALGTNWRQVVHDISQTVYNAAEGVLPANELLLSIVLATYQSILGLAIDEISFVRRCCTDISAWNFQQQRMLSLRYAAFCSFNIRAFIGECKTELLPRLSNTHGTVRAMSADWRQVPDGLQEQLGRAFERACSRLRMEDTYERGWAQLH